jgi:hypothetical protein
MYWRFYRVKIKFYCIVLLYCLEMNFHDTIRSIFLQLGLRDQWISCHSRIKNNKCYCQTNENIYVYRLQRKVRWKTRTCGHANMKFTKVQKITTRIINHYWIRFSRVIESYQGRGYVITLFMLSWGSIGLQMITVNIVTDWTTLFK